MNLTDFEQRIKQYGDIVNEALEHYLPDGDMPGGHAPEKNVLDAMRYSVTAGGKRIRPMLTMEFCRISGGNPQSALPFACAVEYIHTYSLIHDDLPCMDNDDIRRGQPSCHVKFGEATALLAGDALLSLAFETALCNNNTDKAFTVNAMRAAGELAHASGAVGMVGGQIIDLESEGKAVSLKTLELMHRKKTGAMIVAAAKMGCIVAGADEPQILAAEEYAKRIGLAFQIVDDLLDVAGDQEKLGKPTGSDCVNKKTTYITHLGIEKSSDIVKKLTEEAVKQLDHFNDGAFLAELALRLSKRDR
jgi:geranylgeranyl diphosphate synthase, type II